MGLHQSYHCSDFQKCPIIVDRPLIRTLERTFYQLEQSNIHKKPKCCVAGPKVNSTFGFFFFFFFF